MFTPILEEDEPILRYIFFKRGWFNHQPDDKKHRHSSGLCHWFLYFWASWRIFDQTSYWRRCYRATLGIWILNGFCGEFQLMIPSTNIPPKNCILKMIFLFPRWDMLVPWRVFHWSLNWGGVTLPEANIAGWKIHHVDGIYQDFDGDSHGRTVTC